MELYACLYKKSESVPLSPNITKLPLESKISMVRTKVEGLDGTFGFTITKDKDCPTKLMLTPLIFQVYGNYARQILKEKIATKVNWDIKAQVLVYNQERSADFDPYDVLVTIPIKFTNTNGKISVNLGEFEVVEPKK